MLRCAVRCIPGLLPDMLPMSPSDGSIHRKVQRGRGLGLVQLLIWLERAVRGDEVVICIGDTMFVFSNRD